VAVGSAAELALALAPSTEPVSRRRSLKQRLSFRRARRGEEYSTLVGDDIVVADIDELGCSPPWLEKGNEVETESQGKGQKRARGEAKLKHALEGGGGEPVPGAVPEPASVPARPAPWGQLPPNQPHLEHKGATRLPPVAGGFAPDDRD
jgi:hypothetical protein